MVLDLSFKDLADVAADGMSDGRPLKVALDLIDQDPDQPRREFPEDELQQLAASIRIDGILQPIVVRHSEQAGRFVIVMGARRYRAAKIAELVEAPVFVQHDAGANPYAQMVENIQRDDLKPSEIARFITARLKAGEKQTGVARRLGKPRDWVSRYAAVPKMPGFLQDKLTTSSIRAVYELYQAWRQEPSDVERAVKERDAFTDAQAREFASAVRSPIEPAAASDTAVAKAAKDTRSTEKGSASAGEKPSSSSAIAPSVPRTKGTAIVRVRAGKRAGRLVLDARPNAEQGSARVAFDDGGSKDVPVGELRIDAVLVG
jgi:ParB family chromosome partitioning protein